MKYSSGGNGATVKPFQYFVIYHYKFLKSNCCRSNILQRVVSELRNFLLNIGHLENGGPLVILNNEYCHSDVIGYIYCDTMI